MQKRHKIIAIAAACAWAVPTCARAHPGSLIQARGAPNLTAAGDWFVWDFHESILVGTLALAAAWLWATGPWRQRRGRGEPAPTPTERWCTLGGLFVLYFSLDGPLHHLSDELLFSAHMLQHMLLQLVWAPLFVLGVPAWLWRAIAELPGAGALSRWLTRPWIGCGLFQAAMWLWHWPPLYDLALQDHRWHIVEHLCFMVTAVVFWFIVVAPIKALARSLAKRMVFIALNMTVMKALGLILSLSSGVIYSFYLSAPRTFGLDPLSDQQVGGMIMWMPGGGLMWLGLGRVFWLWVHRGTPARGLTGVASIDRARAARASDPEVAAATLVAELSPDDQPGAARRVAEGR